MYEFDSVSASSFEAAELAATLTEKSADGWEVAAIVTAGSDVVAYLKKATGGDAITAGAGDSGAAKTSNSPASTFTMDDAPAATGDATATATATAEASPMTDAASPAAPAAATPASSEGSWGAATTSDTSSSGWGASSDASSESTPAESSSTPSAWSGAAQQSAAASAPAPTPPVPAGWYADPAGRYELRYWDGGAWTEHVSRAGQQYTDPPVA